jgi:hypothetical protein
MRRHLGAQAAGQQRSERLVWQHRGRHSPDDSPGCAGALLRVFDCACACWRCQLRLRVRVLGLWLLWLRLL